MMVARGVKIALVEEAIEEAQEVVIITIDSTSREKTLGT
jgi:hypothetical protein